MSDEPMTWASKDAPTKDPYEHSVLTVMAQATDEDGCNALLSATTIAERAKMSVREVRDNISALLDRGLIGYGDQSVANYIRADKRPKVYDLLIPHAWFGPQPLARINRFRGDRGRPPMVAESCTGLPCADRHDDEVGPRCGHRPAIMDAPPRKVRSDAGKKRAPRHGVTDMHPVHGVTDSPPGLPNSHGVNTSSSDADLSQQVSTGDPDQRGAYNAPNLFLTSKELTSSSREGASAAPPMSSLDPEEEGKSEPRPQPRPSREPDAVEVLAEVLAAGRVSLARSPAGAHRARLLGQLAGLLEGGWPPQQLTAALSAESLAPADVRSVYAVLATRARNLDPTPPAPARIKPRVSPEALIADCDRCDLRGYLPSGSACRHDPAPAGELMVADAG